MEGGICTCDDGGGGKFGGALGEIMAFPLPPVLMGDIVAAEFLGDTWAEDLPLDGEGPLEVPTLTTVVPPIGL